VKLRRTLLWATGGRLESIEAAIASNADCVVLDLEDTVSVNKKDEARETVVKALSTLDFRGKERVVRINAIDTDLGRADIAAILPARPDSIRLPKCESSPYVLILDKILANYERTAGIAENSMEVILMIESPLALIRAYELASCAPRVSAMGVGAEDFTTDLRTDRTITGTQWELLYARQKLAVDASAAQVDAIDTTCPSIENIDGLIEETKIVKQMGFVGKSVATPEHADIVNKIFTPKAQEVERAQKIMEVARESEKGGRADVYLNGRLVDKPLVMKAEYILMLAQAAGVV
jgi:citrate lyase subunit beta/citryl-CoA lyase